MFKRVRRALSAARQKSRSVFSRLAHKSSFSSSSPTGTFSSSSPTDTSSLSSSGTLVAAESELNYFSQALTYTRIYSFRDPFEDVFPVIAGNNEAELSNIVDAFDTEVADYNVEVVSSEHTETVDIGNKAADTGNCYSIPSVVYSDFDCPSMISLEYSMGGDSSHGLGVAGDLGGEDSNTVTECNANNCSIIGIGSGQLNDSIAEEKAKAYFNGLSESERTTLSSVLLSLINWDEGNSIHGLDSIRMHSVLRMTYYRRVRYGQATPALPLMTAAINLMGIENAMNWVLPMIESYSSIHTSDDVAL